MNKSQSISNLAMALVKAQAEMPVIKMNAQNPFLKNKYADLGAVIEGSRSVLAKHQLSISQFPTSHENQIGLTTLLIHSSGEWIEETIYILSTDSKGLSVAQSAGVVISYLRRYSWAAILGLYADEDTDGHVEEKKTNKATVRERYSKLYNEAVGLGLEDVNAWQITNNMTDNEIIEMGKQLREFVDAKKAGK